VTPERLRYRLAEQLIAAGDLTGAWRAVFEGVPRHLFAPPRGWVRPDGDGSGYAIDRAGDPGAWWAAVYSDAGIITQVDDGRGDPGSGQGSYTSSLSAPGAVFQALRYLYVQDGHRVLDIGTGTGWTAALLSQRVGEKNVTSIEIDPMVAQDAAKNLGDAGFQPRLVIGDGADGRPEGAPYDRVHVTCGVRAVPYAWVEQSRPGGIIVAPWNPGWAYGHLLRLVVAGDHAVGELVGSARYMMMRSQRHPRPRREGTQPQESVTLLDPRSVVLDSYGCDVALAALLPGVVSAYDHGEGGELQLRMWDGGSSWATAEYVPGRREFPVLQHGARRLWEETAEAYLTWIGWGRPDRTRFGLTVTADGQHMWRDTPDRRVSPLTF
jgi:protein-L-isoaspartate O-methyltransferase